MQIFIAEGFDYEPGPYTIVFNALTTSASFDITIFDNHTFEASESFYLTLNLPSFVFLGNPSKVIATILDHRGLLIS